MKRIQRLLSWGVTILVPLAFIFLGLRLVLTHAFLEIEYRLPNFPADEYGFSLEDRLQWSKISWDYMLNNENISFLGDQTFPDGTALYNERELSHMLDVKKVIQPILGAGYAAWFLLLGLAAWSRLAGWWLEYKHGLRNGGWFTVGLVSVIGIFAAVSFWQFFTLFHQLFFTGDTWLFLFSDTLIRLFPLRFWRDIFIFIPVLIFLIGLGLGLGLGQWKERKPKNSAG